jgi:Transglutaminase-like superfamily
MGRLAELGRLSATERRVLALAWMLLLAAPLWLRLLPLRRLVVSPRAGRTPRLPPKRVAQLVDIASRRVPGARCLPVAVVTAWLLAWQGSAATLRIGVARDAGDLTAHAWVECDGVPLAAGEIDDYRALVSIAAPVAPEAHR